MTEPGNARTEPTDGVYAPEASDQSAGAEKTPMGPQSLEELFGGRRGIVDGAVPPIVFVITNSVRHNVREAALAAVGSAVVLLLIRLARKERTRHVFSGLFGVLISAGIAARSGRASNFFLTGIVLNAGYLAIFLLSVIFRRPIVGLVLKQFSDKPAAWHAHPRVRRAYSELTLMWAVMYGLRVAVQEVLRRADADAALAVTKIVLGYPPLLLVLAITMPYLRWRTKEVPEDVADGDADADADAEGTEGMPTSTF